MFNSQLQLTHTQSFFNQILYGSWYVCFLFLLLFLCRRVSHFCMLVHHQVRSRIGLVFGGHLGFSLFTFSSLATQTQIYFQLDINSLNTFQLIQPSIIHFNQNSDLYFLFLRLRIFDSNFFMHCQISVYLLVFNLYFSLNAFNQRSNSKVTNREPQNFFQSDHSIIEG